jgi:hypothetical protein
MLCDEVRLQGTWLDWYYDRFVPGRASAAVPVKRRRLLRGSAFAVVALFAVNAALAHMGDFVDLYFGTYQTYLAIVAIVWGMSFLRWGTLQVHGAIEDLALSHSARHVRAPVRDALLKLTSTKLTLTTSALVAGFFVALYYGCWVSNAFECLPPFLRHEWYEPPGLGLKHAAITWVLVLGGFFGGTAGYQIAHFSTSFVRLVGSNYGFESVQVARESLAPLARVSLTGTWSWSIGIALVVIMLFPGSSPLAWWIVAVITSIAVAVYFGPQFHLHDALASARATSLHRLRPVYEHAIRNGAGTSLTSRAYLRILSVEALEERYNAAVATSTWFVSARGLSQFALSLAAPVAAAFSSEILSLISGS